MNFWKVIVPVPKLVANVHLSVGTLRRLLNLPVASHQPVILPGASAGNCQVQKYIDAIVHNLRRLDLVDGVPEGYLSNDPAVHDDFLTIVRLVGRERR